MEYLWIIYGISMDNLWNIYGISMDMVGGLGKTPLKNMSSSIGMMTYPIHGKIKYMFQSTNQMVWDSDGIIVEYEKKKLIINLDH